MGELDEARIDAVLKLLELAPDAAVETLEGLAAATPVAEGAKARLYAAIAAEALDRRVRNAVFAPLAPLFAPATEIPRLAFPHRLLVQLWGALKACAPELVLDAVEAQAEVRAPTDPPPVYDEICRQTGQALRSADEPAFAAVAAGLDAMARERLSTLLMLAPGLRDASVRLDFWMANLGGEQDAAMRVAFRLAAGFGPDAGFLFTEGLFAHLDEPSHILRFISAVMDKPTDRYVAASELASFGERVLQSAEAAIDDVRRYDTRRGLEGGVAVARAAALASLRLTEFEQNLLLAREGVWGARVAANRRALSLAMEMRLREMEPAVGTALPAQSIRAGTRRIRGSAIVAAPPEPAAVDRAVSLMALLDGCRASAATAGFGALRTKVAESLDGLLEAYVRELLDLLHRGRAGADAANVRAFLDLAAEFVSLVRGPGSADLVRRRAAAA